MSNNNITGIKNTIAKNNSIKNNSGNKNLLGLKRILREKIGFKQDQLEQLYGDDLIKSVNLFYFYKYLNNNNIIPKELKEIFDICNICKNDFNLTEALDKILPKKNNSSPNHSLSEKFYGIVLESSRREKKIKILKINNDPNYIAELLIF